MLLIYFIIKNFIPCSLYFIFKLFVSLLNTNFIAFIKKDIFIISIISLFFINIKAKNLNMLLIPYFFIFSFKSEYVLILNEFLESISHHDEKNEK